MSAVVWIEAYVPGADGVGARVSSRRHRPLPGTRTHPAHPAHPVYASFCNARLTGRRPVFTSWSVLDVRA